MGGPLYRSSTCAASRPCSLYQLDGTWRLAVSGSELLYVAKRTTGTWEPPLDASDWSVADGTGPCPALVAGPKARRQRA
jgi:hypothetical protein